MSNNATLARATVVHTTQIDENGIIIPPWIDHGLLESVVLRLLGQPSQVVYPVLGEGNSLRNMWLISSVEDSTKERRARFLNRLASHSATVLDEQHKVRPLLFEKAYVETRRIELPAVSFQTDRCSRIYDGLSDLSIGETFTNYEGGRILRQLTVACQTDADAMLVMMRFSEGV